MKSGQPALQLSVRGPSGNEKRTAAQERAEETGEQEDRGRRRRRNQERRDRGQEGEKESRLSHVG